MKELFKSVIIVCLFLIIMYLTLPFGNNNLSTSYKFLTKTIQLNCPVKDDGRGGVIAADLDGDSRKDFIITKPGYIGAWSNSGKKLWVIEDNIQLTKQSEYNGLPGWHAPGVQVGDIDNDNTIEVLYLTNYSTLKILNGKNGKQKYSIEMKSPHGSEKWEHLVISNFRGEGDHDLFLQATEDDTYRMGRFISAYTFDSLISNHPEPLWQRDDFVANAHSGARVIDLDGDGKDEVVGATLISSNGDIIYTLPFKGHVDSIAISDIRPDIPGLEFIAFEEGGGWLPFSGSNKFTYYINKIFNRLLGGGNHISLSNINEILWISHYKNREPQNSAIGNFDLSRKGLEVWCRSRYKRDQKPFVFDSKGDVISTYELKNNLPLEWTDSGIEEIVSIHWTGEKKQLCAAKERHISGKVCIFDPMTGQFYVAFDEKADRLYVSDVYGDWREELIVLNGDKLNIYQNNKSNTNPHHKSLWENKEYRRSKMTWNYYNP